ncbi:MAG: mannonate dehydratase, partial [Pedobacter sp.]
MKLSFLFFGDQPDEKWELCKQMGIQYAIAKLSPEHTSIIEPWKYENMKQSKDRFTQQGFDLIGLEGDQFDMTRIKFGLEGRDEDLEHYREMLLNMGRLGINLLCYNFMAGIGWYRTHTKLESRGGAWVTAFDSSKVPAVSPVTIPRQLSPQDLWDNYRYFLQSVLPVAEEAKVKLALHPDDPPVENLMGIPRIFVNANAIRIALALSASPFHGITFCQGTYTTMGEDLEKIAGEFRDKIFFLHIRDIEGDRNKFKETFHDNGQTNMPLMFKLYKDLQIDVPLRSDHVPGMAGEDNERPG